MATFLSRLFFSAVLAANAEGPPPKPWTDPASASNPHLWLDFLGYFGEMYLLVCALATLLAAVDLLILKRWLPALILFLVTILIAVIAIALPGVLIIIDTQWCADDSARFVYVHGIEVMAFVFFFAFALAPFTIAKARDQPKLFILFTKIGAVTSLFFPLAWVVAMHFAFARSKKRSQDIEQSS